MRLDQTRTVCLPCFYFTTEYLYHSSSRRSPVRIPPLNHSFPWFLQDPCKDQVWRSDWNERVSRVLTPIIPFKPTPSRVLIMDIRREQETQSGNGQWCHTDRPSGLEQDGSHKRTPNCKTGTWRRTIRTVTKADGLRNLQWIRSWNRKKDKFGEKRRTIWRDQQTWWWTTNDLEILRWR